jgi:hypothetical protein
MKKNAIWRHGHTKFGDDRISRLGPIVSQTDRQTDRVITQALGRAKKPHSATLRSPTQGLCHSFEINF